MPIHISVHHAHVDSILLLLYLVYFVTIQYRNRHVQPLSRGGFPKWTSGGDRRLDPSLSLFPGGEAQQFRFSSTSLHFSNTVWSVFYPAPLFALFIFIPVLFI